MWVFACLLVAVFAEEICDESFGRRIKQSYQKLSAALLDGSWVENCLPKGVKPATEFHQGVLTVAAGAALQQRAQSVSSSMQSGTADLLDVLWIHDFSEFGGVGLHMDGERITAWEDGGQRFSRKSSNSSWMLQLNFSAFAVYLASHFEVHITPAKRAIKKRHAALSNHEAKMVAAAPNFYILVLDSLSRSMVKAMLPKTWQFLESMEHDGDPGHQVFGFDNYSTVQFGGTTPNLFPLFFGGIRAKSGRSQDKGSEYAGENSTCNYFDPDPIISYFLSYKNEHERDVGKKELLNSTVRSRHIFDNFRKAGFETAWNGLYYPPETIVTDDFDFLFPPLNRFVSHSDACHMENGCFGQAPMGLHMLRYTEMLLQSRQQAPRMVYSHVQVSHPIFSCATMHPAKMVNMVSRWDQQLHSHLKRIVAIEPATAFFVLSDHGLKSPSCDNNSPFLYIGLPSGWLSQQNSQIKVNLRENSNATFSNWDLHETLLHFLEIVTFRSLAVQEQLHKHHESDLSEDLCHFPSRGALRAERVDVSAFNPQSLMRSTIAKNRTCAEMGLSMTACGQELWTKSYFCQPFDHMSSPTQELLTGAHAFELADCSNYNFLVHYVIDHINTKLDHELEIAVQELSLQGYNSLAVDEKLPCVHHLSGRSIELVHRNDVLDLLSIRFSVNEGSPARVFEARMKTTGKGKPLLLQLDQITKYAKYEICAPAGTAIVCICGDDKIEVDKYRRDMISERCFSEGLSRSFCCGSGPPGQERCWNKLFTYELCCQGYSLPS